MDEHAERIGLNEALFREVNERVKAINADFGEPLSEAQFVCECGDDSCTDRVRMTLPVYEALRANSAHFAVRPGHELPDVETVVERAKTYLVVEKHPGGPARLAAETDPRT